MRTSSQTDPLRRILQRRHRIIIQNHYELEKVAESEHEESIPLEEFEKFRQKVKYVLSLPEVVLKESIQIFIEYLNSDFPIELMNKAVAKVIKKHRLARESAAEPRVIAADEMEATFSSKHKFMIDSEQLFSEEFDWDIRSEASKLVESLLLVLDFFDVGGIGFLSGDLSPSLLKNFSKELEKGNMKRTEILSSIKGHQSGMSFRLPENGIPKPSRENQQNLFERQLTLEKASFTNL